MPVPLSSTMIAICSGHVGHAGLQDLAGLPAFFHDEIVRGQIRDRHAVLVGGGHVDRARDALGGDRRGRRLAGRGGQAGGEEDNRRRPATVRRISLLLQAALGVAAPVENRNATLSTPRDARRARRRPAAAARAATRCSNCRRNSCSVMCAVVASLATSCGSSRSSRRSRII